MRSFIKTLFGDGPNVAVVAVVVVITYALLAVHADDVAVYAMPLLAMAGIVWLARH